MEAIQQKKIKYLQVVGNKIQLRRTHNYYYQIQGQLEVTDRNYCIFYVYTPKGCHSEIVTRDRSFFKEKMFTKFKHFYNNVLLPEIIDSRDARNLPIRE